LAEKPEMLLSDLRRPLSSAPSPSSPAKATSSHQVLTVGSVGITGPSVEIFTSERNQFTMLR
jgi:hypothetical protein